MKHFLPKSFEVISSLFFGSCCTFGLENGHIYLPGNLILLLELASVQLFGCCGLSLLLSLLRAVILGNKEA